MPRPRFQFRLSTLLWLTLAVACWIGGMRFERWWFHDRIVSQEVMAAPGGRPATMTEFGDGRRIVSVIDDNGDEVVVAEYAPDDGA